MKDPNTELKRARKKGRAILEEAKIKALSIIAQAYGEEIQKMAQEMAVGFKNEALVEMARFKTELEEKVLITEGAAEKVLNAELVEVKAEIERYKESQKVAIDAKVHEVIVTVTKEVLGKSIDTRAHEDLILKALEDAKRQNLF